MYWYQPVFLQHAAFVFPLCFLITALICSAAECSDMPKNCTFRGDDKNCKSVSECEWKLENIKLKPDKPDSGDKDDCVLTLGKKKSGHIESRMTCVARPAAHCLVIGYKYDEDDDDVNLTVYLTQTGQARDRLQTLLLSHRPQRFEISFNTVSTFKVTIDIVNMGDDTVYINSVHYHEGHCSPTATATNNLCNGSKQCDKDKSIQSRGQSGVVLGVVATAIVFLAATCALVLFLLYRHYKISRVSLGALGTGDKAENPYCAVDYKTAGQPTHNCPRPPTDLTSTEESGAYYSVVSEPHSRAALEEPSYSGHKSASTNSNLDNVRVDSGRSSLQRVDVHLSECDYQKLGLAVSSRSVQGAVGGHTGTVRVYNRLNEESKDAYNHTNATSRPCQAVHDSEYSHTTSEN